MVHKVLSKQEGNEREVKFSQCLAQTEDPEDAYAFTHCVLSQISVEFLTHFNSRKGFYLKSGPVKGQWSQNEPVTVCGSQSHSSHTHKKRKLRHWHRKGRFQGHGHFHPGTALMRKSTSVILSWSFSGFFCYGRHNKKYILLWIKFGGGGSGIFWEQKASLCMLVGFEPLWRYLTDNFRKKIVLWLMA